MSFDKSQIQIQIDFSSSDSSEIYYDSFVAPQGNNVSESKFNGKSLGENPYVFGASPLGGAVSRDNSKSLGYFMGEGLSDFNGNLMAENEFVFQGEDITMFQITFNEKYKRWATKLSVNGVIYNNDKSYFIWRGDAVNLITLKILQLNQPFYPIEITSLGYIVKTFDKSDLVQGSVLIAGSQKTTDNESPTFGVNSNYGNVPLFDKINYFKKLAELKILKASSETPIKIFFNGNLIGDFTSDSWDIRYDTRKVSAELKDELLGWNDIFFSGIENNVGNTLSSFFDALVSLTTQPVNISAELRELFNQISCPDGYIEAGNLIDAWQTFCDMVQCNIVKKTNGEIWCI